MYRDPQPTEDDLIEYYRSGEYRRTRNDPKGLLDVDEMMRSRRIYRQLGKVESLLDVGCSRGYLLKNAMKDGAKALGVELNPNWPIDKVTFVTSLDDVLGQFHAIACIHTLEHVTNPRIMADKIKKLLLPGGKLIVEVPSHRSKPNPYVYPHLCFISEPVLKRLFSPLQHIETRTSPRAPHTNMTFIKEK